MALSAAVACPLREAQIPVLAFVPRNVSTSSAIHPLGASSSAATDDAARTKSKENGKGFIFTKTNYSIIEYAVELTFTGDSVYYALVLRSGKRKPVKVGRCRAGVIGYDKPQSSGPGGLRRVA